MPRYVVLEHDHPTLHWDLMLEAADALRTWRLAAPPAIGQAVPATKSFDHRRHYLDYEGPVSGNRGRVQRWDAGTFVWLGEEDDHVAVQLEGSRLNGRLDLLRERAEDWTAHLS
jgi:hypothetical protein